MAGTVTNLDLQPLLDAVAAYEAAIDKRLRMAMGQLATEIAVEAKQNHAYVDRTGKLTASIHDAPVRGTFASGLRVDIVAGGVAGVSYAAHVEFGTRPHIIESKQNAGSVLAAGGVFATKVRHPGTRAYRFMRNALERKMPRAQRLFETALELAGEESGF